MEEKHEKKMLEYAEPEPTGHRGGYTCVKRGNGPVVGGVVRVHQERGQGMKRGADQMRRGTESRQNV